MKTVTIAGAGIIGLASAWRLAQRGWQVTIFDRREAVREASWAAAGMLAPGGEIDSDAALAEMALRSLAMYPEFVRDLEEESGLPVEYRKCGAVEVAFDNAGLAALTEKAARQAGLGIASAPCRYGDLAGRRYPDDAMVDPLSINEALIAACRQRGVAIREHEPVMEILSSGSGVRTNRGEYGSDSVLIAAGAWSSTLFEGLPRAYPVRGHLLCFDMEPGLLTTILRGEQIYLFQREAGGVIAGSSMEDAGFDRTLDTAVAGDLQQTRGETGSGAGQCDSGGLLEWLASGDRCWPCRGQIWRDECLDCLWSLPQWDPACSGYRTDDFGSVWKPDPLIAPKFTAKQGQYLAFIDQYSRVHRRLPQSRTWSSTSRFLRHRSTK